MRVTALYTYPIKSCGALSHHLDAGHVTPTRYTPSYDRSERAKPRRYFLLAP